MTVAAANDATTPVWTRIFAIAAIALCYFVIARGSLYFASLNASATPIWPPTGFAIAVVMLRGHAILPAIFVGAFAANWFTTPDILTSAGIAAGNTLEAFVAVFLLHRLAEGVRVFHSPVGVAKFAGVVIAAAAPVSASIGVLTLALTGFALWSNFLPVWITWWLGDVAGAILVAPALVLWTRTVRGEDAAAVTPQTLLTLAAAALIGLIAFSPLSPAPIGVRSALAFLAILPLLWAALQLGLRDAATTALVISAFAIWGVLAESSPFNQASLNDSLLLLAAFIAAATLPSLALAADRSMTQAALSRTREELVQAQKLEALGQLTGGVAHDFNNLLASVQGGMRALRRHEEDHAKTLELMNQTLDRGAALTKQLLAFARREPLQPEMLDVGKVMHNIEAMIRQSLSDNITIDLRVGAGLWPVLAERHQLELAVLNLAFNARDAMPNGGAITISAENVATDEGSSVAISVDDTGEGMPADVAARAFEPFFSTKPAGAGTGLGLAQVYGFAKDSGGGVIIDSLPGEGTTVTITLPRA